MPPGRVRAPLRTRASSLVLASGLLRPFAGTLRRLSFSRAACCGSVAGTLRRLSGSRERPAAALCWYLAATLLFSSGLLRQRCRYFAAPVGFPRAACCGPLLVPCGDSPFLERPAAAALPVLCGACRVPASGLLRPSARTLR